MESVSAAPLITIFVRRRIRYHPWFIQPRLRHETRSGRWPFEVCNSCPAASATNSSSLPTHHRRHRCCCASWVYACSLHQSASRPVRTLPPAVFSRNRYVVWVIWGFIITVLVPLIVVGLIARQKPHQLPLYHGSYLGFVPHRPTGTCLRQQLNSQRRSGRGILH